ncbi:FHA domain-containing protein [Rhizobium leguminosarum]|nr:FHA domain-containing protein [Rhizobium leguminosarum]
MGRIHTSCDIIIDVSEVSPQHAAFYRRSLSGCWRNNYVC